MYKEERMRPIPVNNITPIKYPFLSSTTKPKFSVWIYRITYNEAMTHLKEKRNGYLDFLIIKVIKKWLLQKFWIS